MIQELLKEQKEKKKLMFPFPLVLFHSTFQTRNIIILKLFLLSDIQFHQPFWICAAINKAMKTSHTDIQGAFQL